MPTMYDSVTAASLPVGGDAYAGYVDGDYRSFGDIKARFPTAQLIDITVTGADATCFDVEPGNPNAAAVGPWAARRLKAGRVRPIIYFPASWGPQVLASLASAGVGREQVRLWAAHWGTGEHICTVARCRYGFDADATQWISPETGSPGHYDISLLSDNFFQETDLPLTDTDAALIAKVVHDESISVFRSEEVAGILAKAVHDQVILVLRSPEVASIIQGAAAGGKPAGFPSELKVSGTLAVQ